MDYLFLFLLIVPFAYFVLTIVWFVRTRPASHKSSENALQTNTNGERNEAKIKDTVDQMPHDG